MREADRNRGFTLLELAAVMTIGGLILAAFGTGYQVYRASADFRDTNARLQMINAAIEMTPGHYPCPAEPHPSDKTRIGKAADCASLAVTNLNPDNPAQQCTPGGLCRVRSPRKLPDGTFGTFLVGTVPFQTYTEIHGNKADDIKSGTSDFTLRSAGTLDFVFDITDNQTMLDAWGNQIIYAVSDTLTNKATFDDNNGVIGVTTEKNVALVQPDNSAHYVIFSAGKNGVGAYRADGTLFKPCTTTGMTKDEKNCQLPATFLAGLQKLNTTPDATGKTPDYFDDQLYFKSMGQTRLWARRPTIVWKKGDTYKPGDIVYNRDEYYVFTAAAAEAATDDNEPPKGANWTSNWQRAVAQPTDIYNTNTGGVWLGTPPTPVTRAKLDIYNENYYGALGNERNIDSGGGIFISNGSTLQQKICDEEDGSCFTPEVLGGAGFKCGGANQVLTGIANIQAPGDITAGCATIPVPAAILPKDCTAFGQLMVGITATGSVICALP